MHCNVDQWDCVMGMSEECGKGKKGSRSKLGPHFKSDVVD
jgi:hypothetical protein